MQDRRGVVVYGWVAFLVAGISVGWGCGSSGDPSGNSSEDGSGSASVASSEDPLVVKDAFVKSCSTLTRALDDGAKLVCKAESSRAAFKSLQGLLRNIIAQQFSQFTLEDLLLAISTGTGTEQDSVDEILNRPDMNDLGNRLLRHLLPVLKKLLGKEEYDFVCAPDRSVWPEFQFANTMKWAQENLLADDLIVDKGPGTITFKVIADRACKGWAPLNGEAWFKDMVQECKEVVQAAGLQLALTLTQAGEIQAAVKFNGGKDTLINFVVSADRNKLTIPIEPGNVLALLRTIGTNAFVGAGSQASGGISVSLSLSGKESGAAALQLSVAVTSPLELSINFHNGDKKLGQAKLKISVGNPILDARLAPDGVFALSANVGSIGLSTKPEPGASLPMGALEGEIPGLTFDLRATGKPFEAKLSNFSFGPRTLLLRSGTTPAIQVDLNPQANRKADLTFTLKGEELQVNAQPEFNLLLDLKYVEGMTATLKPFMKSYAIKLPAGPSPLKVTNTLGLDLVIMLLDQILSQV